MPLDVTTEVIDQLESHWSHQLRPRLDGLTDEEYFWEPVPDCWSVRRRGESRAPISYGSGGFTWDHGPTDGVEPMTTIAWRLGHLAEGLASTAGSYFGGPRMDVETGAGGALHERRGVPPRRGGLPAPRPLPPLRRRHTVMRRLAKISRVALDRLSV